MKKSMLSELAEFIRDRKRASLRDLSVHFAVDAEALRGMLDMWVRKGRIAVETPGDKCGSGCCSCDARDVMVYVWAEAEQKAPQRDACS